VDLVGLRLSGQGHHQPGRHHDDDFLVRAQIESGELASGQPVPSITTLAQEHGVARQTAGKALRVLEEEGRVTRVPGLGYYVA
jgi:GntR family transcriptional regulator